MTFVLARYGHGAAAGGWASQDVHPREAADVNGDGRADIVGFGEAGTYVSLGQANGSFGNPIFAIANFAHGAGGWSSENTYPRQLGDVNGDGRADIVGFGEAGTYVSLGRVNGSFAAPIFAIANFGHGAGGWSSNDLYPREVADVNGDGRADVIGFGEAGTYVSLGRANGTFAAPIFAIANYAHGAGGWSSQNTYPREVADVNGDHRADVIGFGEAGTYVSLGRANGTFAAPIFALANFGHGAGGWSSEDTYPRSVGDVNGDGRADIVGFGEAGTYVSLGRSNGTFTDPRFVVANYGHGAGGWSSENTYPRTVGDVNGDHRADIIGFGEAGVYVSLSNPWFA